MGHTFPKEGLSWFFGAGILAQGFQRSHSDQRSGRQKVPRRPSRSGDPGLAAAALGDALAVNLTMKKRAGKMVSIYSMNSAVSTDRHGEQRDVAILDALESINQLRIFRSSLVELGQPGRPWAGRPCSCARGNRRKGTTTITNQDDALLRD